jgi:hypothetical protein
MFCNGAVRLLRLPYFRTIRRVSGNNPRHGGDPRGPASCNLCIIVRGWFAGRAVQSRSIRPGGGTQPRQHLSEVQKRCTLAGAGLPPRVPAAIPRREIPQNRQLLQASHSQFAMILKVLPSEPPASAVHFNREETGNGLLLACLLSTALGKLASSCKQHFLVHRAPLSGSFCNSAYRGLLRHSMLNWSFPGQEPCC